MSYHKAIRTGELLSGESFLVVANADQLRDDAFSRFRRLPPSVSFTDCIVMACADSYGTKDIFGFHRCLADNGYSIPTRHNA